MRGLSRGDLALCYDSDVTKVGLNILIKHIWEITST